MNYKIAKLITRELRKAKLHLGHYEGGKPVVGREAQQMNGLGGSRPNMALQIEDEVTWTDPSNPKEKNYGFIVDVNPDGTYDIDSGDSQVIGAGVSHSIPRNWIRKAQSILSNPEDTTVGEADPELEALRQQFKAVQEKINIINTQVAAYTEEMAKKQEFAGMSEIQMEVTRLQTELNDKLKAFPANFIKFSDQVTFAKIQSARLNDAAWKQIIDQAKTRGKGVMRRVSLILDRVALLFKKMTADVTLKEFGPGELTPKKMQDTVKKNKENLEKIDQYQQTQQDIAPGMQKYFLDQAAGGIGTPGKKQGQAESKDQQLQFDFLQDLINDLEDSIEDINALTEQVSEAPTNGTTPATEQNAVEDSYPLPKVASKLPKFSSANTGLQKLARRWASKPGSNL